MFVGIDYSISSPAICLYEGNPEEFCFRNCKFLSLIGTKKLHGTHDNIEIRSVGKFGTPIEKYVYLSQNVCNWLIEHGVTTTTTIFIEDYSYGSTGRVFHLGENGGILKAELFKIGLNVQITAPTQVKKFATGKGNANKEAMYQQFLQDENVDLLGVLNLKRSGSKELLPAPVPDIVDAYYVCKYGAANG